MKRFLQLKHWQVFLFSWGLLTAFFSCLFIWPDVVIYYLQIWITIFLIGITNSFIWVWSTVTGVISTIPSDTKPNSKIFKICFWIPTAFISYLVGSMLFNIFIRKTQSFNADLEIKLYFGLGLLSIGCIIYGLLFTAKTIKTAELKREVKIYEYFPEFALLIFAPFGLWIIQPRLNKIARW